MGEGAPYCACLAARDAEAVSRGKSRGQGMETLARSTQDTGPQPSQELGPLWSGTYHAESGV